MTDPLDHDADGKKGGSVPDPERAAIIAKLDAAGVTYFKGATTDVLRSKLPVAASKSEPVKPPAKVKPPKPGDELVSCEITKNGDGKVCTGEWDSETNAAETYSKGDTFRIAKSNADELEDRGFVVIR